MSAEITVFIVDDDQAMAESVRWLIESVGFKVKVFRSARDFLSNYHSSQAGCLVLDVRMPEMTGLELQEQLNERNIDIPIIFVTGHGDVPMATRAMKAGAIDFLMKPFNDQMLLESINKAIELDQQRRQAKGQWQEVAQRIQRLTPRERQIMGLVVQGKLNKVIAQELTISPKTVELHRAKVMEKMGVDSLAELVARVVNYEQGVRTDHDALAYEEE